MGHAEALVAAVVAHADVGVVGDPSDALVSASRPDHAHVRPPPVTIREDWSAVGDARRAAQSSTPEGDAVVVVEEVMPSP